jgi:hypothetical protein
LSRIPVLFSYGTLQEDRVQLSTFGRLLRGQRDELPGFEPSLVRNPAIVRATGKTHHANAMYTGHQKSSVRGTLFEISDGELAAGDEYERAAGYKRIQITPASAREA